MQSKDSLEEIDLSITEPVGCGFDDRMRLTAHENKVRQRAVKALCKLTPQPRSTKRGQSRYSKQTHLKL